MNNILKILKKSKSQNQLIMFPFAGGHGRSYANFVANICSDVEIVAINPVGHFFDNKKPIESIMGMVELYSEKLRHVLKNNVIIYGHSLGGIVAFEFCRKLEEEGQTISSLFLTGSHPPHRKRKDLDMHSEMKNDELIQKCIDIGGMDVILAKETEFCDMFCKGFRADLVALEKYNVEQKNNKIKSQCFVFFGKEEELDFDEASEWEQYIDKIKIEEFPGNHFFIFDDENRKIICKIIDNIIKNKIFAKNVYYE